MPNKEEEWQVIAAPKIKMLKEHGRHLRLDDEAERKLIAGASAASSDCEPRELFRDIVILTRDLGLRNGKRTLPDASRTWIGKTA